MIAPTAIAIPNQKADFEYKPNNTYMTSLIKYKKSSLAALVATISYFIRP
jgi:hypothetical protein